MGNSASNLVMGNVDLTHCSGGSLPGNTQVTPGTPAPTLGTISKTQTFLGPTLSQASMASFINKPLNMDKTMGKLTH